MADAAITTLYYSNPIDKAYLDFREIIYVHVIELLANIPTYSSAYAINQENKIKEFIEKNEELSFVVDHMNQQAFKHMQNVPNMFHSMLLTYAISHFDVFLSNMMSYLFNKNFKLLKTGSKTMTYAEVLSFESMLDLKKKLIDREIYQLGYGSIKNRIEYFKNKLHLDINFLQDGVEKKNIKSIYLDNLIETYSARNIIIHNNGVVNEMYLKDNHNSSYKLGEKLNLTGKYIMKSMYYLDGASSAIHHAIKAKYPD